jgi:putative ABC transport system permease protein
MRHALIDAARALVRRPGFTLVAVLTLAVGVGASSAVFSVVHAVVLRPLPFPDADRLVVIEPRRVTSPETVTEAVYVDVMTWREGLDSFDEVAAFASGVGRVVTYDGDAERVPGKLVTWNFFSTLGLRPILGRDFTSDDGQPGALHVAIIHESLWRGLFGSDPDVVGRRVEIDGEPTTIVGVMPRAADVPVGDRLWTPVGSTVPAEMLENVGVAFLNPFGRLAPGATPAAATAELDAYMREVVNQRGFGETNDAFAAVRPFAEMVMGDTRLPLLILLGATLLVLLVACANVANLQLVRALDRRRDAAIRLALGADPRHLVRGAIAESTMLAVGGATLGVGLASLLTEASLAAAPALLFRSTEVSMSVPVLLFTVAITALVAVASGTAPAVWLARRTPRAIVRAGTGSGGAGATRTLSALVTTQVALAVTLLVGAGLLGRTFIALYGVDTGFERTGALTLRVPLFYEEYDDEATDLFYESAIAGVEALPGVERAGAMLLRPLETPYGYDYAFTVEGRPPEEQPSYPYSNYQAVTPGYFQAMGIDLLAGRDFGMQDESDAPPVAVIGERFAERFWAGGGAVGSRLKLGPPESEAPWITVVGVVDDATQRGIRENRLDVYVPARQAPWPLGYLAVRTSMAPAALVPAVQDVVSRLDSRIKVMDAATMGAMVSNALARPRFLSVVLGAFAAAALLLGAMGLYGVLAYAAVLRSREMGVRMAIGATRGKVLTLVIGWGMRLTASGIAIGLGVAWLASTWLGGGRAEGRLYGVTPTDPATYAAVCTVFTVVALLASWAPARRATKVDPLVVLKE